MDVQHSSEASVSTADPSPRGDGTDQTALESLLILHADDVLGFVKRNIPAAIAQAYEPEDVLQDVCTEACRRLSEFSSGRAESFLPWLLTITRNHMLALLRRAKSQKRGGGRIQVVDGRDAFNDVASILESLAIFYRTPSLSAMSHEAVAAVQHSIDQLSPDQRRAIQLRYIEGLAVKDAASQMDRTEGEMHLLCNRGLRTLRENLKSKSYFV